MRRGICAPFLEQLGYEIPPYDFRLPGVTEMSCDVHKYGYATKGASVILHRNSEWIGLQYFLYTSWPSGLYGTQLSPEHARRVPSLPPGR